MPAYDRLRRSSVLLVVALASTVAAIPYAQAGTPRAHVNGRASWGSPTTGGRIPVAPASVTQPWHLGWRAENAFPYATKNTQTCRIAAPLTATGDHVRAEFTSPVVPGKGYTISSASIAPAIGSGLTIETPKSTPLTFGGSSSVLVRPGAVVLSDPVPMFVSPGVTLDVTMTVPAGDADSAEKPAATAACATGAVAATASASTFRTTVAPRWLQSVLVSGPAQRSVVAFGDSITAGPALDARWSDELRFYGTAVANASVSGSRLTGAGMYNSVVGTTRAAAVLAEPGVTDLVMLIGSNDAVTGVSYTQILNGMAQVIALAKAKHVQVWVCTILPRNAGVPFKMNITRHQVNDTLRTSWLTSRGAKLIDTDAVLRDPANPESLLPAWDSGDHTHPNAAGEEQIGLAVAKALGLD